MDLLADIGAADQLTSVREENKILQARCKELTARVKVLTVENESLKAEVEMYRQEAALPTFSKLALGQDNNEDQNMETIDTENDDTIAFFKAGNGVYPMNNEVTLSNLHGNANLLSCSLSDNDVFLATGGADGNVRVTQWGAALSGDKSTALYTSAVACDAPVIATAFSPVLKNTVAAGCMDGKVHLVSYQTASSFGTTQSMIKCHTGNSCSNHLKYVRQVAWSPTQPILATCSADGSIQVYNISPSADNTLQMAISKDENDEDAAFDPPVNYDAYTLQSLHLPGPVETISFNADGTQLIAHARGTPYLSFFDLNQEFALTKFNLNKSAATGGFDEHVSFTVMDLHISPNNNGNFLACATDTSRNIILDVRTKNQVRNLYGHQNDGFSQPKVAWSCNGQYLIGNTQNDNTVCIWDIASSKIVKQLDNQHTQTVRDLFSSTVTDTLVTTSFDKQTKFWMAPM